MPYIFCRRRFHNRFVTFLTILGTFLIISFIIRSDPIIIANINREDIGPRLFCVLIHTHSTHEEFIYLSNITWAKHCHKIGIVRYKRLQTSDDDLSPTQSPYHVNLWIRILIVIRQSISSYEYISTNDSLVIVPAPTFVFREKLVRLLHTSTKISRSPLIIIYELQEANAYILNGQALNLVRNTQLIDSCLQQSYPSARETHLWKCVKYKLSNEQIKSICKNNNCFIQYYRNELTIDDIKNGSCLQNNRHICQSIVLLYPTTFNDIVTLEFFKYRLKPKSSHTLL
ncbi:unnamed protein product [Rotaria sp. Silwood1]|nr:unnamed protein product [Rotaria sp. Silwood1]CAF0839928.1 unnamed protein product [Rotaria sp. Silwood1]CAF3363406.1 unnamed protein product [Rotaria sp. Silwood1]CAF3364028.1 unnamed protein product [Rotaria sp. Silwood1]CAF4683227.1 unnamed protein product [Rotaria sp. Silwood1]